MDEKKSKQDTIFDMAKIKAGIENKLKGTDDKGYSTGGILEQKTQQMHETKNEAKKGKKFVLTGISGFDELFENGIPKGSNILVAGGAGSGKTIFCLQTLWYHISRGEKCFYMSFEESEKRLLEHMEDFGWNPEKLLASGNFKIKRYLPSDIHYISEKGSDNAMFAKEEDSQLLQLEPITLEEGYNPDFVVIDSLTAIASAFMGKEGSYRFYAERLFRFFENMGSTNYFITETGQMPETFSQTGVEEFLADGVIVLYNIKRENMRERAIEVLKMRGTKHQERIVAMKISEKGMVVYPKQEIFGEIKTK
jgi:KaiC/GvpD/RAD55 family RecA-like ATPase